MNGPRPSSSDGPSRGEPRALFGGLVGVGAQAPGSGGSPMAWLRAQAVPGAIIDIYTCV